MSSGTSYFVNRVDATSVQLAFNPTRLTSGIFVEYSGIGTHFLIPVELKNKDLSDQRLLKRIPITPTDKDSDGGLNDVTTSKNIGIFANGVEIRSHYSPDQVWYGQIQSVDVLEGGSGYDVLNPPIVTVTDGSEVVVKQAQLSVVE